MNRLSTATRSAQSVHGTRRIGAAALGTGALMALTLAGAPGALAEEKGGSNPADGTVLGCVQTQTVQTGQYLFTVADEDFSGVVHEDQVDVTVRAGEMSHKVKGVPFEWGNGYGLVDHDDVQAAFDELSGEGAVQVAQLEVRVNDTMVAIRHIDLTAGPDDSPFPEHGTNFGCDETYTTSGGGEARPHFHAATVPVGQSVDTPFSTELNPLGGSAGDGETVPVTLTSASTSGDEFALVDESLTPEQPGLYVSERIYEGEDGSQYREWVVVEALDEDAVSDDPVPGDDAPEEGAPAEDGSDEHTVPDKVETRGAAAGGLALAGLGGAGALVALRRKFGLA